MPAPKIETFLTDPKHEEQRTFLEAFVNATVDKRVAAIKAKKDAGGEDDENFFDSLFGGKK